jgi:hypothetical protein
MRAMSRWLWLLVACGCALEAPDEAELSTAPYDDDVTETPIEASVQAIKNGTPVSEGMRGVVEIETLNAGKCTGAMIGTRFMITSAHCIAPALPTSNSGPIAARVRYFKPGGTIPWVTDNNNDGIGDDNFEALEAWIFDSYDRDGHLFSWDYESDLALVRRPAGPWARTRNTDYLPISVASCSRIDLSEFFGRGYNASAGTGAGVLRKTPINNHGCEDRYFYSLAGTAPICRGDSGGPFIVTRSGLPMISGLFSSSEGLQSYNCTTGGGEQYGTRLRAKTAWIESKMGWVPPVRTTADGHSYKQYWFD